MDRVTAIDVYALPLPEESASSQQRNVGASALGRSTEAPSERPWPSAGFSSGDGGVSRRLFGWGTRTTDVDALDGGGARSQRWDQAHGWGDGWVVEGGEPEGCEDDPTVMSRPSVRVGAEAASVWMPSGTRAASYPLLRSAVTGSVGRGRGRGRGAQSSALGNVSGGSYGDSGSIGGLSGELNYRTGGAGGCAGWTEMVDGEPQRLGKRQGYAGRGQGEDPRQLDAYDEEEKGGEEKEKEDVGWKQGESLLRAVRLAGVGACRGGRSHKGKTEGWKEGKRERQWSVLFTGSDDGTAKAWDAESGQFLCIYAGHTRGVICLQATLTEVRF